MFGISKMRQMQQVAQNPKDSDLAKAGAKLVAGIEHDLLDAVADLHGALDVDDPLTVDTSPEERVDRLLELADAASDGELERYWFEEAGQFEDVDAIEEWIGVGSDTWGEQVEKWAEMYRESVPDLVAEWSDREIAQYHVAGEFGGASLEEFEREVVGYSRRKALKGALAGNVLAGVQGVRRATEHARSDGDQDGAEELPEDGMHPNSPQPENGGGEA